MSAYSKLCFPKPRIRQDDSNANENNNDVQDNVDHYESDVVEFDFCKEESIILALVPPRWYIGAKEPELKR